MNKTTVLLCNLLCFLNLYSQEDSIKTIDFAGVEKKLLETPESNRDTYLKYDFKIIDSLYFYENSFKEDILKADYKKDFEIPTGDRTSIFKFECKETTIESCYQYAGYSENAEMHLISKCREVCELYLIDSYTGSTLCIESEFDGGSYPVFLPAYMIVYASYHDDSFGDFYEYRSIIDIYEMQSTHDLEKKFNYLGRMHSKKWSIQELYQSKNENSFLIKIFDKRNEFDYIEITIEY